MLTVPSSCHSNCRLSGQVCFFVWAFPQQSPQSWIVVVRSSAPSRPAPRPVSSKSAASRSTYVETLRYLSLLSKYANLLCRDVFSVNSQPMPLPSLNNKLGAREGGRARVRERDWDFVSCSWASQACSWRNAKKSKTCAEEVRKKAGWGKYGKQYWSGRTCPESGK